MIDLRYSRPERGVIVEPANTRTLLGSQRREPGRVDAMVSREAKPLLPRVLPLQNGSHGGSAYFRNVHEPCPLSTHHATPIQRFQ